MANRTDFDSTFEYKLIYVFRINDMDHTNCVKIGDATIHTEKPYSAFFPCCSELNYAARKRIDEYTATAGIHYDLIYTEIAVYYKDGKVKAFRDYQVHEVLKRSGIKVKCFDTNKTQNEWFVCDLETAKNAIKAVKEGKTSLNPGQTSTYKNPIIFRPEQREAIKKTLKQFKSGKSRMLWNAKMRFGKTLTALEVVKEMGFKKTIIITHRPVVDDGWFEDFQKIFYEDNTQYRYGSKNNGESIDSLLKGNDPFVYFASIQDLRGSAAIGGNFNKNDEIFGEDWDFIIIDEAHEGTQTELGKSVLEKLLKGHEDHTKALELSGTPFNLLSDFEQENIYTWDYIMEQEAKMTWNKHNFCDSNPYAELPKLNIFTYHLEKSLPVYIDVMDKAFNFKEFFRPWTGDKLKDGKEMPSGAHAGDFVHEQDIKAFLDLILKEDNVTNYPFSTEQYRDFFRHTLWIVPGVKEAKALSKLLKNHHIFEHFEIVNVAGEGDEEIDSSNALEALHKAMTEHPENTRTITLSCGRLTTGVTVREWTAVLYLAGSYSTAASQYLQTIFRVQSPANIDGKIKENCYVFDFAPDRTLKMIADSVQLSTRAGAKNVTAERTLAAFLNYCPVISIDGSNMKEFKVSELLQQLKNAYIERVQRNGFDDPHIYNEELLRLDDVELEEFDKLKGIIGESKQAKKINDIEINKEGFSQEEIEEAERLEKKPKKELTPEEKARLEELKKHKKNRQSAISILRGISIRMPLLVYGMDIDIDTDVTIDNFADLIDDNSWKEFMPNGVTKEMFKKFTKYYDKDIFVGASRRIRAIAKTADELEPTERVKEIAGLFATFKNPDKETVLTPWRVVNMHMSNTIGGYHFFDEQHENTIEEPRFVDQGDVNREVFNKGSNILEINSKTGLYPLYVTYSLYREFLKDVPEQEQTFERKLSIWDKVVTKHIYVICKTDMAKQITKRTLQGYRSGKINAHAFDDLIMQMKEKQDQLVKKIKNSSFWGFKEVVEMKFNAVVGNPPYQEIVPGRSEQPPVYHYFYDVAFNLSDLVTLITPARFLFNAGKTPKGWNEKVLNDIHFKVVRCFMNSADVFDNVDIKGGVAICIRNEKINYGGIKKYFSNDMLEEIYKKVSSKFSHSIGEIMCSNTSYKYSNLFFSEHPEFLSRVSGGSKRYLSSSVFTKFPEVYFDEQPSDDYCKIIGLINNKRFIKYFPIKYLLPPESFKGYKVIIPASNGSGALGEKISTPMMGHPMMGHTESFISIGNFATEIEAEHLLKYVKTRFARLMLGVNKVTQGNKTKETWKAVPLEDYGCESDVDWNKTIEEIDYQLFKKYELSDEEINYILSNVQEMK